MFKRISYKVNNGLVHTMKLLDDMLIVPPFKTIVSCSSNSHEWSYQGALPQN